ncbi:MAG: zf-HC2 domain-containing protein [Opitutaceae bacterium]|nr:zf-HC2 domain-containing protein [Opitutaceae bacterium]
MTCREFREGLHDYLDCALDRTRQAAASEHVTVCPECRHALERAQAAGRVLRHALERTAAEVALTPELSARILARGRVRPAGTASLLRGGQWLFLNPFRVLGAGAIVALALLALYVADLRTASRLVAARERPAFATFTIDVPFQTDRHAGVIHAEFSTR